MRALWPGLLSLRCSTNYALVAGAFRGHSKSLAPKKESGEAEINYLRAVIVLVLPDSSFTIIIFPTLSTFFFFVSTNYTKHTHNYRAAGMWDARVSILFEKDIRMERKKRGARGVLWVLRCLRRKMAAERAFRQLQVVNS